MKAKRRSDRRGVLLLVILGLLAMFGLVGVAFVVLTGQAMRSAETVQRIDQSADPPRQLLERALMQALRGSNNAGSVMGPYSLLEDKDGNDYLLVPQLALHGGEPYPCGGQLFKFQIPGGANARAGCVMTMLSGPAAGQSTHIVGVIFDNNNTYAVARMFESAAPQQGDSYLINGVPFSGTGIGYNPTNGKLDAMLTSTGTPYPMALCPNPTDANFRTLLYGADGLPRTNDAPAGLANEDYDAPDFQNMLLGAQIYDPYSVDGLGVANITTIPSLHRPALLRYWANQHGNDWDSIPIELKRRIMLRPLVEDNPEFAMVNPDFNPLWSGVGSGGRWDVDNDGDTVPDSIWVDLGMPVRSTADGRCYKPLFAILCLDMDGRLNLNAHGNWGQTFTHYRPSLADDDPSLKRDNISCSRELPPAIHSLQGGTGAVLANGAGGAQMATLPRGQGYGPAEVNLLPLFYPRPFPDSMQEQTSMEIYRALLGGEAMRPDPDASHPYDGRYGGEMGSAALSMPGVSGIDDLLSRNKAFDYWSPGYHDPSWMFWNFLGDANYLPNSYGSPVSIQGTGAVGLDMAGHPLYLSMDFPAYFHGALFGDVARGYLDDPYEIDLSRPRGRGVIHNPDSPPQQVAQNPSLDNPFSPAELERLLRPFDRDTGKLPDRLARLTRPINSLGNQSVLHHRRHELTVGSFDVACPSPVLPRDRRSTISSVMRYPVQALDSMLGNGVDSIPQATRQVLFAPEILAGLKMDLNRPFGDGRDNNNNGVVDEPGEVDQMSCYVLPDGTIASAEVDHDNDGAPGVTTYTARQTYARHLYVLLKALVDEQALILENDNGIENEADASRFLAQWAVNVVDFRDRDSIMTRFVYDPSPENGWNPTGQSVVYGCERPELLITESLALHDRRTEDLDTEEHDPAEPNDDSTKPAKQDVPEPEEGEEEEEKDVSFDQAWRPQGSLFVELYNPWSPMEPRSTDLNDMHHGGVDLRATGNDGAAQSPVWRLAIAEYEEITEGDDQYELRDPDHPDVARRPDMERFVYFVDPSTMQAPSVTGDDQVRYYPSQAPTDVVRVLPGRYAVIGSGESGAADGKKTYIGFLSGGTDGSTTTRQIDLTGPTEGSPLVVKNNLNEPNDPTASQVYPPTVLTIDRPNRMSISEPTDGYTDEGFAGDKYEPPRDIPLDADRDDLDGADNIFMTDQTVPHYRIVYLQRLANPLLPWNQQTNPYRTIDAMPVDLTIFNGVTSDEDEQVDSGDTKFASRQRGYTENQLSNGINNLWKQEHVLEMANSAGPITNHYFNDGLRHSLGYLNSTFGMQPMDEATGYKGFPRAAEGLPFPWLNFNNRPFVSQLELLLVPALRSSKLLARNDNQPRKFYGFAENSQTYKPYDPSGPVDIPYPHLLNFFDSDPTTAAGDGSERPAAEFHRLLEFVHVPSRFVGTETQMNPARCAGGGHPFHPPLNRVPSYREPGRININTIYSYDVFRGLMNFYPGLATNDFWLKFVKSRRGYDATGIAGLSGSRPTRFAGVFRSSGSGSLVPPLSSTATGGADALQPDTEIEATLLRSDPTTDDQFPLFHEEEVAAYDNTNRNPYFRYQALQRLGNLVTTRSNVYAIWITVGYFEVVPVPTGPSAVHPDGYALGPELGSETGEIERHRGFYMFDRSIPVGFQRGKDLNVENGLLIKRFIE